MAPSNKIEALQLSFISVLLAFILSIVFNFALSYSFLPIFSIALTSEGLILTIYQISLKRKKTIITKPEKEYIEELYDVSIRLAEISESDYNNIAKEIESIGKQLEQSNDEIELAGKPPDLEPVRKELDSLDNSLDKVDEALEVDTAQDDYKKDK